MNDPIKRLAEAIAKAEGFYSGDTLPKRNNNPGALKDASGRIALFESLADGWQALYRQVELMLTGQSAFYNPDMTFLEVARLYTGNDKPEAWASIVSGELGLRPENPLSLILIEHA